MRHITTQYPHSWPLSHTIPSLMAHSHTIPSLMASLPHNTLTYGTLAHNTLTHGLTPTQYPHSKPPLFFLFKCIGNTSEQFVYLFLLCEGLQFTKSEKINYNRYRNFKMSKLERHCRWFGAPPNSSTLLSVPGLNSFVPITRWQP
jgi:hypothetical protein